jgi:signal transduction histidine kinase
LGTYAQRVTPTQIIHGEQNVVNTLLQIISNAKYKIDTCVDYTRPYLAVHIKQLREVFLNAKKRGIKVRYLTEINKENLYYCKQLLTMVDELRHLGGIKGNFYVTDEDYGAPATSHEKGRSAEMMIYSHLREVVEHQQYIFESIWNTSTSAERKIKEIESEDDIVLGITQVIDSPLRIQELFLNLIKSANYEILLLMPTVNAFLREHNIGAIQLLKESAYGYITQPKKASSGPAANHVSTTRKGRMSIRIITPTNDAINKIINDMDLIAPSNLRMQRVNEESVSPVTFPSPNLHYSSDKSNNSIIQLRHLESLPKYNVTTATILVVDRKASLVFEKIDDTKENFVEAVGLSTFSTSEPTIMSYVSIFENFWNQVDLYEKLKEHDKLQKEFINIASHELRTPTQAILGYSTLVRLHPETREEMLSCIERNAIRLQSLINNILDVSRIESRTLKLNKEKFNINEKIRNVIDDIQSKGEEEEEEIKIIFSEQEANPIIVEADKLKIYEVVSNLLANAVKFTKKKRVVDASNMRSNSSNIGYSSDCNIIISSIVKSNQSYTKDDTGRTIDEGVRDEVVISIKDRGTGIDPDIQNKLFSKFVTKSDTGSGLGLYISKGIVEAHGGKIWAENNSDGNGATFTFTLAVS